MKRIYFDMDGVLAKWDSTKTLEQVCAPGYFKNCEVDKEAKALLDEIAAARMPFGILTAVPTAEAMGSKMAWLRENFPYIKPSQVTFVPFGDDKSLYVDYPENCILVDDYTKNLLDWKGVGVKFLNGINDTHSSWRGMRISGKKDAMKLIFLAKGVE